MQRAYGLANNVFACVASGRVVFLDLRRNRYFCLREDDSAAVEAPLGFTRCSVCSRMPCDSADNYQRTRLILSTLLRQGLIQPATTTAPSGLPQIEIASVSAAPAATGVNALYTHHHLRKFALASLVTSWNLRLRSMQKVVDRVKRRKHKNQGRRTGELLELLAIFERLRPLYARQYVCLYDSLALLEFLARHGYFADWVFGVKSEPFGAHCWLQYRDRLLNDSVDYVRNFTPIMVV